MYAKKGRFQQQLMTRISPSIQPVWSELKLYALSLSTDSEDNFLHVDSKNFDPSEWSPRLIKTSLTPNATLLMFQSNYIWYFRGRA